MTRPDDAAALAPWGHFWVRWVSATFLRAWLDAAEGASFVPASRDELRRLLTVLLLEKSVYELGYELDQRPDWVQIPLTGILRILRLVK